MTLRALVLVLACAAALPAAAQLRATPQLGTGRPAPDASPRAADYIVAVVNSEPITNHEVRSRTLRVEQQMTRQGAAVPPRQELVQAILERLIAEKAQLQLARESGIRITDGMVDQAELNFARQNNLDLEQLRRRLQADGVSPQAFREDLRNQMLLSRLREREVDQRVRVTEQDVDQFIRDQGAGDVAGLELNLGHVLIALPDAPTEAQVREAQAKAQRVLEQARAGQDFGRLAREFSDAAGSTGSAGEMGLRAADRYPPLFVEAVQNLPEGSVANLLRSPAGFHVLKVLEKRSAGLPSSVTQNRARHILLRPGPQLSESAARARLADFRARVQAGQADFAQLAREASQDASAVRGGDLGWANPGTFVPEFEEVLNGLQPGQIAEPMVSRFGVHLIQLLERRTAELSQREQREIARNLVRERKIEEAYATWAQEVRGRAYVELREPPT
jgi:peptidyl-prolyl cis-trans isomerase SurA